MPDTKEVVRGHLFALLKIGDFDPPRNRCPNYDRKGNIIKSAGRIVIWYQNYIYIYTYICIYIYTYIHISYVIANIHIISHIYICIYFHVLHDIRILISTLPFGSQPWMSSAAPRRGVRHECWAAQGRAGDGAMSGKSPKILMGKWENL